ncbi:MAG: aldehyde dehydrogenase [Mycobacterium sp.]|nr:aldehyde dehydrogenase [Mycobacterium sp.]
MCLEDLCGAFADDDAGGHGVSRGDTGPDLGDGYAALRPAVHLLDKPDIAKLNIELGQTHHRCAVAALDNDGYLADFLMRNKGFIRG